MLRHKATHVVLVLLAGACVAVLAYTLGRSSGGPSPAQERSGARSSHSALPAGVPEGSERATVTDHVDGDTLRVVGHQGSTFLVSAEPTTVRLLEIDTPEGVDPGSPEECYAADASRALEEMLPLGAEVWAKPDRDLLDPYGRTLLYLWDGEGRFVNLEMVRGGYARAVLFEPNDEFIEEMRAAQRRARAERRGLWGECGRSGKPPGLLGEPPSTPTGPSQPGASADVDTDPRFRTCATATRRGFGDYRRGVDPEYGWYVDADADGVACER